MAFCTDAEIKTSVAAAMHLPAADLPAYWDDIITDANAAAYQQIVAHFLELGFSSEAIDAWDGGPIYQKFLARYQSLIDGAGDKTEVGEWRAELDYWRGLLAAIVFIESDGEPSEDSEGTRIIGHGPLSTADDIFRLDPDGRGEITRW